MRCTYGAGVVVVGGFVVVVGGFVVVVGVGVVVGGFVVVVVGFVVVVVGFVVVVGAFDYMMGWPMMHFRNDKRHFTKCKLTVMVVNIVVETVVVTPLLIVEVNVTVPETRMLLQNRFASLGCPSNESNPHLPTVTSLANFSFRYAR